MRQTEIPLSVCRNCGTELEAASNPFTDRVPSPGAISMCLACGTLSRFGEDLALMPLSEEEVEELCSDNPILSGMLDQARQARRNILPPWLQKERLS